MGVFFTNSKAAKRYLNAIDTGPNNVHSCSDIPGGIRTIGVATAHPALLVYADSGSASDTTASVFQSTEIDLG